MRLLNQLAIETRHGLRTIELYEGDLTAIGFSADLLAILAFQSSYVPTRGTVIASLAKKLAIKVEELWENCALDLTASLGIWISRELKAGPFRRLLCVEIIGQDRSIEELIENVFVGLAVLEAKGMPVASNAMEQRGQNNLRKIRRLRTS
jgi:hypothetical protein